MHTTESQVTYKVKEQKVRQCTETLSPARPISRMLFTLSAFPF